MAYLINVASMLTRLSRGAGHLALALGLIMVAYQAASVWFNLHGAIEHYVTHLTGLLIIAALLIVAERSQHGGRDADGLSRDLIRSTLAIAALLAATASGLFFYLNARELEITQPFVGSDALVFGTILMFAVLILTGLVWSWVLAGICAAAALYFVFGGLLPDALAPTAQQPLNVVISYLAGIGGPRGVLSYMPLSADMIFLLLVYGGLLHGCKVIDMFGEIGRAIGNLLRGGVAFSAVVASLLIGTVTGQAVSNIALSGCMTIPTMSRSGFSREQAGGIEVMASTGSQLLPPIMGLGAFLMAEILGVSYIEIVIAALIPGLLYVAAISIGTFALISASEDIPYVKSDVDWQKIYAVAPSFLASFVILLGLLIFRYSPAMAGFWGGVVLLAGTLLRRQSFRPSVQEFVFGLRQGIVTAVQLGLVLAAIGLVVQTLTSTGTGISLGRMVFDLSGGSLALGLIVAMFVCLIVGMGLPTPAAYALIAILVTPSLIDLGLSGLSANMFGFYFAIFSALTPPVAVGVLTATRISGGDFGKTALQCAKLGGIAFLVPFLFVAAPGMLDWSAFGLRSVAAILAFLVATTMLAGAVYGGLHVCLSVRERALFAVAGPGLLLGFLLTQNWLVGGAGSIVFGLWLLFRFRTRTGEGPPIDDETTQQAPRISD